MLDTVILEPKIDIAYIADFGKFGTTKEAIMRCSSGFAQWINNPTKEDWNAGIYKPRLTLTKRGSRFYLKIEFSAQKLIKNDLEELEEEELEEEDFIQEVEVLQKRLEEMGVKMFKVFIENASVSSFHPAKNIPLSDGYTAILAIRELAKVDVSKKLDIETIKFRNRGESLQIYSIPHSLVFYDKISDLNKPAKRAIDKDQTLKQFSLFEYLKNQERNLEVLRMEDKLRKKRKMNEVLTQLGYPENPTFKDIFKRDLCQKILKHYWDYFFSHNLFLFGVQNKSQKFLNRILKQNPKIGIKKAIYQVGFLLLCKDNEGMRGFRNVAELYKPKTNWTNLKKWLVNYQSKINAIPLHGFIKDIEKALDEFKPFRFNEGMNNSTCLVKNCKV